MTTSRPRNTGKNLILDRILSVKVLILRYLPGKFPSKRTGNRDGLNREWMRIIREF